ncbi:hypothetical protein RX33_04522 [Escherichia coli]|uniref:hypothetical protein n=1 Tax=Escherichia coli TaxID=562 RepID=UPI000B9F3E4E|nr:hypothetical protein [Escherichia coli]OYC53838.1 hypothetical protein RX33_04522 [Escherichia coli]
MRIFFVFLLYFIACQSYADVTQPNTSSHSNISVGTISINRNVQTQNWVTIKTIDIANQSQYDGCGFLCTSPRQVSVNHLGLPFGRATYNNYNSNERTVETDDGELMVRFVYKDLKIRAVLVNDGNGKQFVREFSSDATESEREVTPANKCGNLNGCTYSFRAGIISGTIEVQVSLPMALSNKTYDLGNISVGQLIAMAAPTREHLDFVKTQRESNLSLSGNISVPDRCYVTIDNGTENPAAQSIDFGEIDAYPQSRAVLKTKTMMLRTSCFGVKGGDGRSVVAEVKLEPASDTTVEDNYKFRLKPASSIDASAAYNKYLGVVTKYESAANCNNDDNTFINAIYKYMGIVIAGRTDLISSVKQSYPLVFSLCAFGDDGMLAPGDHTGAITLTMRWKLQYQ